MGRQPLARSESFAFGSRVYGRRRNAISLQPEDAVRMSPLLAGIQKRGKEAVARERLDSLCSSMSSWKLENVGSNSVLYDSEDSVQEMTQQTLHKSDRIARSLPTTPYFPSAMVRSAKQKCDTSVAGMQLVIFVFALCHVCTTTVSPTVSLFIYYLQCTCVCVCVLIGIDVFALQTVLHCFS